MLASDWFSLLLTGKATTDHGVAKGLRAQPEMTSPDRKWEGHVIWDRKPLTSGEKGMAGSGNRKSRDLRWETAGQW